MPTIAVLNEKGGVGKTTISTNLARGIQQQGKSVLLVDGDPQGSLRDWFAAAPEGNSLPPVVAMDRAAQFREFSIVAKGYDWTIIDGAPSVEDLAIAAIKAADIVLIPVQPSPYDIWAAESLVEMVKARQEIGDGTPAAAFVISRQVVGTRLAADVREALNAYGLPIADAFTCQRVIYPTSAAKGSTVLDDEPEGLAAKEIEQLVKELLQWAS